MADVVIVLTNRKGEVVGETIVDEVDARYADRTWRLSSAGYAYRREAGETILLHREVLGLPRKKDILEGDHINRNPLDNRRANLRPVTHAQNMQNQGAYGTSPYRGVWWSRGRGRWHAQVCVNGRRQFLGSFQSQEQAAEVAAAARSRLMTHA